MNKINLRENIKHPLVVNRIEVGWEKPLKVSFLCEKLGEYSIEVGLENFDIFIPGSLCLGCFNVVDTGRRREFTTVYYELGKVFYDGVLVWEK